MRRICLLSPDVEHAHRLVKDLMANGIPEHHIHVIAREGTPMEDLPDAGPEQDDFLPAYERGVAIGGAGGLLAGLFALAVPPSGLVIGGGAVILFGLYGAGLGGLLTAISGAAYPNSRLERFEEQIEQGKLLVMADIPRRQVEHFEELIKSHDPDIEITGFEPPPHLIPPR